MKICHLNWTNKEKLCNISRANLPTAVSKVENFQQIFPRAKSMQAKAGIFAAIGGKVSILEVAAFWVDYMAFPNGDL